MSEPGSSGKAGPTPIPESCGASGSPQGGEQVRPSFHFGMHELHLGDQVTGIHRRSRTEIVGIVVLRFGCVCLQLQDATLYPIQRVAIHQVQPPLFFE